MTKSINEKVKVLEYELPLKVEKLEEGGFVARSDRLQGVLAEGDDVSDAVTNAMDVAANIIQIRVQEGLRVPLKLIKRIRTSHTYKTKVSVQVASV